MIVRNEQLSTLLKDAGIKVPSECGNVKGFKKTRPWSNRISAEQAKVLAEKENKSSRNNCLFLIVLIVYVIFRRNYCR